MFIKTATILLIYCAVHSRCANILFVTPLPSPSHHVFHKILALEFVERGHNVTMLTHETEKQNLPKNFTIITMHGIYQQLASKFDVNEFVNLEIMEAVKMYSSYMLTVTEFDHQTDGFKALWNYPKDHKFDIIIYDSSLGRFMYIFTERFHNPPSIAVIPFLLPVTLSASFGNFPCSACDPYMSTKFTNNMNIIERAYNMLYTYFEILYVYYIHQPTEDTLVALHYPKIKSTLEELENKVGLVLANIDPVLDYPKILPPNIIPIGGLHVKPPRPLPTDLQKIMDDAKSGVILFSLGTNVRSDKLDPRVIQSLMTVFAQLPQTILWKLESNLDQLPKNVIIRKWLPQNDILGHENIKLFITHGGAFSTQEALYHGVPLIVIPFFADQNINAVKVQSKQIGLFLENHELGETAFGEAVNKMLNTEIYAKNMKSLSAKYRDQPLTALERAVFWSEFMIRHGNADHLSPRTRQMSFFKIFHLDIFGIFLGGCFSVVLVIFLLGCFCRSSKSKHTEKVKIKKT